MRRRSAELFPTDKPLGAERMIGRDDELAQMVRQLRSGISLVVAGPRRTGKTTVCRAAMERLRENEVYTVSVDLFAMDNLADLAAAITDQAVSNRAALHRVARRARGIGRSALIATQMTVATKAVSDLGGDFEVTLGIGTSKKSPQRQLEDALRLCQRLAEADDRHIVLFLDEFQKVASPSAPFGQADATTQLMRSVIMESDRITCLFAGSVEHILRGLFTDQQRAFYRFGSFVQLAPIDPEDWRTGLSARAAEDDCIFTDEALDRLLTLTGGHPRTTMLVAQQAHDAAVADDVTVLDMNLVEVGWRAALAVESASTEAAIEHIEDLAPHSLTAIRAIADGVSPYKVLRSTQARRALNSLISAGFVVETGRGRWHLTDQLLATYLSELYNGR